MTSKIKGKGRKARDVSDSCWPVSRERKAPETPKLVERLLLTPLCNKTH